MKSASRRKPRRETLTPRSVAAKKVPAGEVLAEFWDAVVPGLALRVGAGGAKTWAVRYRANGRQRRLKLGRYPTLSLADARDAARDAINAAQAGQDPAAERAERRSVDTTFGALAAEVLEAKGGRRANTLRQYRQVLDAELLPAWRDRPASSITRRDVVLLVEGIARRGAPVQANRALATIKVVFNTGLKRGFPTLEHNPAHRMDPPAAETGRDRYLECDEIKKVWQALASETPVIRVAFRLALLTGQRIGNVCALRWQDIDAADVWTIPAAAFKGKRPHLVPLSPDALAVLEEVRELTGNDEFAFPGRHGKAKHITNVGKPLERVRERSKVDGWTLHDFRTTFRTHATRAAQPTHRGDPAGCGIAPHIADAVLGHAEATLGYRKYTGDADRYLLAEKRDALAKWGAFVTRCVA